MYIYTCTHTYIQAYIHVRNSYNTPRRAVSDLQSPNTRARSVGGDCKSDTARLGVS